MASITQTPAGKYRAQVFVNKERDSSVFRTRREAAAWASARETELRAAIGKSPADLHTLGQLIEKYIDEVSPSKRGRVKEIIRLLAMLRILPVGELVGNMGSETIQRFRDQRLREVKPNSVLRELGTLSSVFEHAKVEWKWITTNPVREIRKPARPAHRQVTITRREIYLMLRAFGYVPCARIASVSCSVAVVFLVALRTGMRAGELCGLTWDDVGPDSCHVSGKTEAADRHVPLTLKARRLIEKMRGFDPVYVFGVKAASLDAMFRKYRDRAGLDGFTFHDARHTAATWMVNNGSLNPFELCKIFGWTDPKMAMIYFNPKAEDLLKRMSKPLDQLLDLFGRDFSAGVELKVSGFDHLGDGVAVQAQLVGRVLDVVLLWAILRHLANRHFGAHERGLADYVVQVGAVNHDDVHINSLIFRCYG